MCLSSISFNVLFDSHSFCGVPFLYPSISFDCFLYDIFDSVPFVFDVKNGLLGEVFPFLIIIIIIIKKLL